MSGNDNGAHELGFDEHDGWAPDWALNEQERPRPENRVAMLLQFEAMFATDSTWWRDRLRRIEKSSADENDRNTLLECIKPSAKDRARVWRNIVAIACLYPPGGSALAPPLGKQVRKQVEKAKCALAHACNMLHPEHREPRKQLRAMGMLLDDFLAWHPSTDSRREKFCGMSTECIFALCDVYREATSKQPSYSKSQSAFCAFVFQFGATFGWERSEDALLNDISRASKADPSRFKNG